MDKFQMLDEMVLLLDKLADARGAERCALLVELVNRMAALKKGLRDEDGANDANIELLKAQLRKLTAPTKDGCEQIGGETHVIDLRPKVEEN